MSTEILKVNAEWLVWARKSVHYDKKDVANKMRVSEKKLEEFESTGELTYSQLMKLSEIYKISSHLFFSEGAPVKENEVPDFRTFNSKNAKLNPNIMFELRRAKQKRETLLNIIEDLDDESVPLFLFNNVQYTNVLDISEKIKEVFQINRVRLSKLKLNYWIKCIESLGVLIFEFYDIDPKDLRGYALYYDELPIIGINHREYDNAKKFTLFHELSHLVIKKEGTSNINEYVIKNKDEYLCNKIAAEILVPTDLFKKTVEEYSVSKFRPEDIKKLANIFNVSKQVIVRKALDLKYISPSTYSSRIDEFNNYINPPKRKRNKVSNMNKKENSVNKKYPNRRVYNEAKISLNKNGKYFTNVLFKAYDKNLLSDSDVALELDVSLKGLDELVKIIWEDNSL